MDMGKLRAWWFARQGLDGSGRGQNAPQVLQRAGWARSVGGANPYLTLLARAGIGREEADRAAAELQIHELPSVRGCTYVLPASDFSLGLRLARGDGDPADVGVAKRHLGLTEAEFFRLQDRVLQAMGSVPLDPKEIKEAAGDAVRSLGDEGKKRGMTTTLPLALGVLQTAGLIRRIPVEGRLDQQRYKYVRWDPPPGPEMTLAEAQRGFAQRYFEWLGVGSKSAFRAVAGLGVKAADAILSELGLENVDGGDDWVATPAVRAEFDAFTPPKQAQYALVSNLDPISHLNWGIKSLVDEADHGRSAFGPKGLMNLGGLTDLENHAILDRGRLAGLWEYDPEPGKIVFIAFEKPNDGLLDAVARTERYIQESLGDMRSFSLDSPESRKPRIAALRAG